MRPKDAVKLASILIFVNLALLMNYLWKGYFILGVFFLKGVTANAISVILFICACLIGFLILRQNSTGYRPAKWLVGLLFVLSTLNLVSLIFYSQDISEFLKTVFGSDVLAGFVIFQMLFLLNNLLFYALLRHSRSAFH